MKAAGERSIEAPDNTWRAALLGRRHSGLAIIAASYFFALLFGISVFLSVDAGLFFRILAADVAATVLIWSISLICQNASVYDPYWSVQPLAILGLLMIGREVSPAAIAFFMLIAVWGIRLTANWVRTFKGLGSQDWRYDMIKEISGPLYPIANLLGIQMMPTAIVFGCILPGVVVITEGATFSLTASAGLLMIAAGIALEAVADMQMHAFRKEAKDRKKIIRTGLWRHSRHPNYLGEIMVWWGTYAFMLASHPDRWFLVAGTLANTALFLFISVPMAERQLAKYKMGFAEYVEETRMFLPWPKRRTA